MDLRAVKIRGARLAVSGLSLLSRGKQATGANVPVLCYHRVLPELREDRYPIYTLTPDEFDDQMAFLARHSFRSLSFEEYSRLALGEAVFPERAVLVTFDDGYADNYHLAWEIASHYGIKLNLFLCTGLIEGSLHSTYGELTKEARLNRERYPQLWRPLNWREIEQMAGRGAGIGFHGHSHRNYGQITRTEIAADLTQGLGLLASRGVRPKAFAFPGGSSGTYHPGLVSLIKSYGLELLFTTYLGRTRLGTPESLFSRLVIYQDDDLETFRRKLFGAYDWIGRARRIDQSLRAFLSHPTVPAGLF